MITDMFYQGYCAENSFWHDVYELIELSQAGHEVYADDVRKLLADYGVTYNMLDSDSRDILDEIILSDE